MDEQYLIELAEMYIQEIEKKNWPDLTLDEIELIRDKEKMADFRKKFFYCFKHVINPLYNNLPKRGKFSFSQSDKHLTSRNMVDELKAHYYKYGYSRDDLVDIITKGNRR
ncbi:MAG: hypothetical protein ACM3O4_05200 [Ignavibacteriales bacterium]